MTFRSLQATCRHAALLTALSAALAPIAAHAQVTPPPSNTPAGLTAPPHVGRFVRGASRDFGPAELGVSWPYTDTTGTTRVLVTMVPRESQARSWSVDSVLHWDTELQKTVLREEMRRGDFTGLRVANERPDSVRTMTRVIQGRALTVEIMRGTTGSVLFYFVYAVDDALIRIRASVPPSKIRESGLELFVHPFVQEAVTGH